MLGFPTKLLTNTGNEEKYTDTDTKYDEITVSKISPGFSNSITKALICSVSYNTNILQNQKFFLINHSIRLLNIFFLK